MQSEFSLVPDGAERVILSGMEDVLIDGLSPADERAACDLIRRNLSGYEEAGSVLAATFRRLENFHGIYSAPGCRYLIARDMSRGGEIIGGAGIGPLHGLSPTEGLGEVRDLVLEKSYRGRGLGTRVLKRCLDEARRLGYQRLYLETTPQMENAQKLFLRFGFRPVTQGAQKLGKGDPLPCYFILEDLTEQ